MPQRLTPSVHSKSDGGRSHIRPPANTPALLQSTSVGAEGLVRVLGQGVDVVEVRRRRRRSVLVPVEPGDGLGQRRGLDVGRDDAHLLGREPSDERSADAAAGAGHDCDLAVKLFHRRIVAEDSRS